MRQASPPTSLKELAAPIPTASQGGPWDPTPSETPCARTLVPAPGCFLQSVSQAVGLAVSDLHEKMVLVLVSGERQGGGERGVPGQLARRGWSPGGRQCSGSWQMQQPPSQEGEGAGSGLGRANLCQGKGVAAPVLGPAQVSQEPRSLATPSLSHRD